MTPPFIIWTLQRTGGTNLTQRLVERAGLPVTEHEPFNRERMHGRITRRWLEDHDPQALAEGMREVCSMPSILKHCVEMVPWEVSEALLRASVAAGFDHLFLYRRRPVDRLLSLHFARLSGIWGPRKQAASGPDAIYEEPLPVAELAEHERRCGWMLRDCWQLLQSLGADPVSLAFEDVYAEADPTLARQRVVRLLGCLGLSRDAAADARLAADVLTRGNQGTRQDYGRFEGLPELEAAVQALRGFQPQPSQVCCRIERPAPASSWLRLATVDEPEQVRPRRGDLGGLLVLAPGAPTGLELWLEGPAGARRAHWGLASPWAQQQFPHSPNKATARFRVDDARLHGATALLLRRPATGEHQLAATFHWEPAEPAA